MSLTRAALLAALCAAGGITAAADAGTLTESEHRGRRIYLQGESASGRAIAAVIGQGETTEIPASALACGSCHGPEGRGVPEGAIEPADVRWSALSRILISSDGLGRRRPRYDDALLARALREGRDSGGEPLSPVMPRYRIDDRDLADLVAYLRRVGSEPQPGLAAEELTVATLIPLSGPRAEIGAVTRGVLEGFFADVNAQGGVYGRKLTLRAIDSAAAGATQRATEELSGDGIFAVLCTSFAELGSSVESLIRSERIPLVTPLPTDAASGDAAASEASPSAFFLFSDLRSQSLALARHVGSGARNVYLVHGTTPTARAAAEAIEERAPSLQWNVRTALAEDGRRDDDLLFLIGVDPREILLRLESLQWRPQIAIAGASLTELPESAGRILLAAPTLPNDLTPDGQRELHAFAERHQLGARHLATQIATYSAAKIFLDVLKRAGRDLTREKLIATFETVYQFPTGLTPPHHLDPYPPHRLPRRVHPHRRPAAAHVGARRGRVGGRGVGTASARRIKAGDEWLRSNEREIAVDPIILGEVRFGVQSSEPGASAGSGARDSSPVRPEAEGRELVRELAIERRDGIATRRRCDGDDDGVTQPGEAIGPDFEHAFPTALVHNLRAGEARDALDDGSKAIAGYRVLASARRTRLRRRRPAARWRRSRRLRRAGSALAPRRAAPHCGR
jgi:ABC-type branched-subunit amino acid transport system substrate-binding protein